MRTHRTCWATAACAVLLLLGAGRQAAAEDVYIGRTYDGADSIETLSGYRFHTMKEGDFVIPSYPRPSKLKIIARAWFSGDATSFNNYFRVALRLPGTSYYDGPWDATSTPITLSREATEHVITVDLPYPGGKRFLLDAQAVTMNQTNGSPYRNVIHCTWLEFYWVYP